MLWLSGDGMLQLSELEGIMRACLIESGMKLPESDVQELAFALFKAALDEDEEITDEINIDQLKKAFLQHEGMLENLSIR